MLLQWDYCVGLFFSHDGSNECTSRFLLQFFYISCTVCSADDVIKKIFSLEYSTKVHFSFYDYLNKILLGI